MCCKEEQPHEETDGRPGKRAESSHTVAADGADPSGFPPQDLFCQREGTSGSAACADGDGQQSYSRDGWRGDLYLCPEGKCNFQKQMQPFKPGAVTLASMANAPILPVYHNGEYNYFFGRRFRCMVGEPMELPRTQGGLDAEGLERETRRLEVEMFRLRDLLAEKE